MSEDFSHSIIRLKEGKNIKYADFVPPGRTLTVAVSIIKREEQLVTLKVEGQIGDRPTLSGRIVLERYNLADRDAAKAAIDDDLKQYFRRAAAVLLR